MYVVLYELYNTLINYPNFSGYEYEREEICFVIATDQARNTQETLTPSTFHTLIHTFPSHKHQLFSCIFSMCLSSPSIPISHTQTLTFPNLEI